MKMKKQIRGSIMTVLFICFLTGCSNSQHLKTTNVKIANELYLALEGISDITLSYDEEAITFYEADGSDLVIREYMSEDKAGYHADVDQDREHIHISEGGKPLFKNGFTRHIEVYLPVSYAEALTITTTDGNIDLSGMALQLSRLRIDSTAGDVRLNEAVASEIHLSTTSGTLKLGSIAADTIRIDSTSGSMTCDKLVGSVAYTSTSGNAHIISAIGSGSYKAGNSGKLRVIYTDVTGDLAFYNKNDDISLTLPADLEFEFEAKTKNGKVSTSFREHISDDGRTTRGTVGSNPSVNIKVETRNGNIEVSQ